MADAGEPGKCQQHFFPAWRHERAAPRASWSGQVRQRRRSAARAEPRRRCPRHLRRRRRRNSRSIIVVVPRLVIVQTTTRRALSVTHCRGQLRITSTRSRARAAVDEAARARGVLHSGLLPVAFYNKHVSLPLCFSRQRRSMGRWPHCSPDPRRRACVPFPEREAPSSESGRPAAELASKL